MATRKKWKLAIWTAGGSTEVRATCQKDAFRQAGELLTAGAAGRNRVSSVTVYVHEDNRWRTFERLNVADFRTPRPRVSS